MHEAQLHRLTRVEQLALKDVGLRTEQPQQSDHLGDTRCTGDQPERDLGQAELDFLVVNGDAVMSHQGHLPPAAESRAVEARHHGLAECFQRAEVLLRLLDFLVDVGRIAGLQPHRGLEVGTGEERGLGRVEDDALD